MSGPDLELERRIGALRELLGSLFNGEELRLFVATLPGGSRLADELPGGIASFAALCHDATLLLHRHGLIDDALFAVLAQARPSRRAEVEHIAAQWRPALAGTARAWPPSLVGADEAAHRAAAELRELRKRIDALRERGLPTASVEQTLRERRAALRAGPVLKAGDTLEGGRYLLVEHLGAGGYGTVWRAWDEQREQQVAIKVLHGDWARHPDRVERFERGFRLMASLEHPNIARVLEPARLDGAHRYAVLELLPGGDLHARVLAGTLSREAALEAVLHIGEALSFAHARGVVHRDVSPFNILLDEGGGARLIDFDLSRAEDGTRSTRTQSSMGTLLYAAPESLSDARACGPLGDVASLSMTAAFCLHGAALPHTSLYQRDRFLAGLACPEALRAVIVRGSAHEPEDRYPDMATFCAELRAAMGGEEVAPVTAATPVSPAPVPPPPPSSEPQLQRLDAVESAADVVGRRPRWMIAAIAGAGLLLAGGFAGIVSWLGDKPAPEEETVSAPTPAAPATTAPASAAAPALVEPPPSGHRANRWITIPAGEGVIGDDNSKYDDEKPRWRMKWSAPYEMQETEVTNAQYAARNPDWTYAPDKADHPVASVNWSQARDYCRVIGGRLPTEAEWEYAARAGTETAYSFGDDASKLGEYAWYDANSDNESHPVAQKRPNAWGLYDVHGNVWEWVEDVYNADSWRQVVNNLSTSGDNVSTTVNKMVIDPSSFANSVDNSPRVFRGGSFWFEPGSLRSSNRIRLSPQDQDGGLGFRCVRGPERQP